MFLPVYFLPLPSLLFLFLQKKEKKKTEKKEPKKRIKEKDKKDIPSLSYPILSYPSVCLLAYGKLIIRVSKRHFLGNMRVLPEKGAVFMGELTKYEQETVINFNAGEKQAVVYTRDRAVMRRLDALVIEFPEVYRLVDETDIDKSYSMPKSCVSYRKPRKLSDECRANKREQMTRYNSREKLY